MSNTDTHEGFTTTGFAIYQDEGTDECRRIDTVEPWVRQWDGVESRFALYSFTTRTHGYVSVKVTGRSIRFRPGTGTPFVRAQVTFEHTGETVGADLIAVGGAYFSLTDLPF